MSNSGGDIQARIDSAKRELSNIKSECDLYREALEIEIEDMDERLKEVATKNAEITEEIAAVRNEYNKGEIQIVTLQYNLETLKKTLKSFESRKCELEILNDNWEQSIRSLEFYNSSLESQLINTEENITRLTSKINDFSAQSKEEFQQMKAKCEEMKKVIKKSRSPSPISKPPRLPMGISAQSPISIEKKVILDVQYKVVVVASKLMYAGETTVVLKDKNIKKQFEFNKVTTKENMTQELDEVINYINSGGNGCVINSSAIDREANLSSLMRYICNILSGRNAEISCIEIIKENTVSLLTTESLISVIGVETERIIEKALQKLSRGRSHILISLKFKSSVFQILDLGEVNDDQSLSESLSINASLFHLEELLMNLSKKNNPNFQKATINRKLEPSLNILMHCETNQNLPSLTFAARLQAIFMRNNYTDEEIHRSLTLLEKERMSNFSILRLIEKVRKDMALLKKTAEEKDKIIENLNKKIKNPRVSIDKNERIYSLSPTISREINSASRIPIPRMRK